MTVKKVDDPTSASYMAPQVTPARDPWAEGYNPGGRDYDGGGYGSTILGLANQVGYGFDTTQPKGNPLAAPASGGAGEDFWGQSIHCAG